MIHTMLQDKHCNLFPYYGHKEMWIGTICLKILQIFCMYVYVCVLEFFSSGSTILPEWRETVLLQNLDLEELLPQQSVE